MGVSKPALSGRVKGFTRQDFLDGKCTADGFPITDAPINTEKVEEVVEAVQVAEEIVNTETTTEAPPQPEENTDGDSTTT